MSKGDDYTIIDCEEMNSKMDTVKVSLSTLATKVQLQRLEDGLEIVQSDVIAVNTAVTNQDKTLSEPEQRMVTLESS